MKHGQACRVTGPHTRSQRRYTWPGDWQIHRSLPPQLGTDGSTASRCQQAIGPCRCLELYPCSFCLSFSPLSFTRGVSFCFVLSASYLSSGATRLSSCWKQGEGCLSGSSHRSSLLSLASTPPPFPPSSYC